MNSRTKLRTASLALLPLLAACGGGGGGGGGGTTLPPSMRAPAAGQLVGNWVLQSIQTVKQNGVPANVRVGMNLRVSSDLVEVFLDEYVGPGSILPDLMEQWYGGGLTMSNTVTAGAFALRLRSDFGPAFGYAKDKWYNEIDVMGTLNGNTLTVTFERMEYVPNPGGGTLPPVLIGDNEYTLTFVPGADVLPPSGDWKVDQISLIAERAFPLSQAQLAPLPVNLSAGATLRLGTSEVAEIFGSPFPEAVLTRTFPELNVRNHYGFLGNGIVQGFVAWEGLPATGFEGVVGIIDLNLFHTGQKLQGDLVVVGILNQGDPGIYHVYLELSPSGAPVPVQLASDGRPAPWLLPDLDTFESQVATYGR